MKTTANAIRLSFDESGKPELILSINLSRHEAMTGVQEPREILGKGRLLEVEVKQHRVKRSLDANAYMWVLLSKMAAVLHTTKDELYLIMLERYGVFTHIIVKPEVVERVKQEWRTVKELGEVTVRGHTGMQLQCYFGSSTYDSKEMARLIDGVVSECRELDIETMTPAELAGIKEEWGK